MQDDRRKNSLWALLLTLLITVGTMALLLQCSLRYQQDPNMPDMTLAQDSILFGGEFVMLGNTMDNVQNELIDQQSADPSASPQQGDEPDIEADDIEDAGEATHKTPPLVTQKSESPHKVKEQPKEPEPKKPGPTKQNDKVVDKPKAKPKRPASRSQPPATPPTTGSRMPLPVATATVAASKAQKGATPTRASWPANPASADSWATPSTTGPSPCPTASGRDASPCA